MNRIRELAIARDDDVPSSKGLLVCQIDLDERDSIDTMLEKLSKEVWMDVEKVTVARGWLKKAWDFVTRWEALGVKYSPNPHAPATVESFVKDLAKTICRIRKTHDGILLLIDEADTPASEAGLGLLLKRVIERFPKEDCKNVGFGIAGQTRLLDRLRISHASSLRPFWICDLKPLIEAERRSVIHAGISAVDSREFTLRMDASAENWIVDHSEGYPHFLQQYCHAAFEANTDDVIDLRDAWNGAFGEHGAIAQLGASYFEGMFVSDDVSDIERQILTTLAENGSRFTPLSEILARCEEDESFVGPALNRLLDQQTIQHDPIKIQEYRIILRSFASWIRTRVRGAT